MKLKAFRIISYTAAILVLILFVLRWFVDIDSIVLTGLVALGAILFISNGIEAYLEENSGKKTAFFYLVMSGLMICILIGEGMRYFSS
ncbi:hypothetical protein [Jeotgalibacillus sp. JSM ZJ347]|uniref:hypothetical protein n=1 Tax=Jeotgalibacillus sp. JSM ZJ347 TaxID=3342117 RepID=UPI0035A85627